MAKTLPLYLHIGRPKVGSTALQHFLWGNRKALREQGFLYPDAALHHRASHKLALVFQPNLPAHRAVKDVAPEDLYGQVHAEGRAARAKAILASSENLFLVEPELVRAQCKGRFRTTIVCYVRRQDEVLVSSYLQELKTGHIAPDEDIEAYASNPERLKWLDYKAVLDAWAEQFGRRHITLRVFEPARVNGSIFEDFAGVAGFSMDGLKAPAQRVNPSPARDVLEFIRMINEAPISGASGNKHQFREPLLAASEQIGHDGAFNPRTLVPNKVRQQLLDRFADSNAALARDYLGRKDGVLFQDTSLPPARQDAAYQGLELERFAHMAASVFCFQQQQIQQLKSQLETLRSRLSQLED